MMSSKRLIYLLGVLGLISLGYACTNVSASNDSKLKLNDNANDGRTPSKEAKEYWYDGTAEISSYRLTQARYGEIHEGSVVLVYVTEPFSKRSNTKADAHHDDNIPVLKLNKTKKFATGIYPYSMMSSSFFPFDKGNSSLKISSSIQEWCGMTYLEMRNEDKWIFDLNSYFEGASFKNKKITKSILEDDLWSLIRLNPEHLPIGEYDVIPSMFYLKLRHKEVKSYKATISLNEEAEGISSYQLKYPELERSVTINFASKFPNAILGWEETTYSGYGTAKGLLTTKAELINTIKSDYWNRNRNEDKHLREELGL